MVMEPLDYVYNNRNGEVYENTLSDLLLFAVLYVLVALSDERTVGDDLARNLVGELERLFL